MSNLNIFIFFAAICLTSKVAGFTSSNKCTVTVEKGTINGWISPTLNSSKTLCIYLSIPYATPPLGPLRFQPPQPPKPLTTPLNGTTYANWCPQKGKASKGAKISEDCLYLNVAQPLERSQDNLLPVLIWFHGGSFVSGSSYPYNPSRILSHGDAIFVSVHYRLGILGFLSTGDRICPGNNGLKDQAFAIRWVHENIQAFGGNPEKITIVGQSAGGASAMYQFLSPLNKGLLSGVIAQSGTALAPWALDRSPKASAKFTAKELGCPSNETTEEMLTCLRKLPWETIIAAQLKYIDNQSRLGLFSSASLIPVVEPKHDAAFISEDPEILMRTGDIPDIPVMIGATKHDGSFILGGMYFSKLAPSNLHKDELYLKEDLVPDLLNYFGITEMGNGRGVASSLEMTYLNGAVNRSNWDEIMPGLVDMVTVHTFKSSVQNTAEILSRRNKKIYLYSFEHHSNNSVWSYYFGKKEFPVQSGIAHGDDLIYIFNMPHYSFSENDKAFSEIFCEMWLNFAKFGNPTQLKDKRYDNWIPYNPSNEPFLKLNGTPTIQYGYRNSWRPNGFQWN